MYEVHVTLAPGLTLGVSADDVDGLVEQYEFMGGDKSWLVDKMREMVPASERGEGVGALSATIDRALQDGDPNVPEAGEEDEAPRGSQTTRKVVDPWSDEEVQEPVRRRSAGRPEPSRGTSAHPASRPQRNTGDDGPREVWDRYDNKYVIGLPDAPEDPNGHGKMVLKTWTNQGGKTFTAYKCPNLAPGGNYSQKCDAHEWPPR